MKTGARVSRRDSLQDHVHSLSEGNKTTGELLKPSQSSNGAFGELHSHLYTDDGMTYETSIEYNGPGHTHETLDGQTSGPETVQSKPVNPVNVQAGELGDKV